MTREDTRAQAHDQPTDSTSEFPKLESGAEIPHLTQRPDTNGHAVETISRNGKAPGRHLDPAFQAMLQRLLALKTDRDAEPAIEPWWVLEPEPVERPRTAANGGSTTQVAPEDGSARHGPENGPAEGVLEVVFTTFPNQQAQSMNRYPGPGWADLCATLAAGGDIVASGKEGLPWIKLATFDGTRTSKNCLRHDDGVTAVYGVELDYDSGDMTIEQAADALTAAGIEALVITSPRYTPELPKLRILAPLATPLTRDALGTERLKATRKHFVQCIDGLLPGTIDRASFNLSQAFLIGHVEGHEYRAVRVSGRCIDTIAGPAPPIASKPEKTPQRDGERLDPVAAFRAILTGENFHASTRDLAASMAAKGVPEDITLALLQATMHESKGSDPERWQARFDDLPGLVASGIEKYGRSDSADSAEAHEPSMLSWDDWDTDPPHINFLIPGWLPEGVVTLFAAHGGTGKSYLSLYIALCLTTGRDPFDINGDRITPIKVLLYSAEDSSVVLKFRLARYMKALGISPDELKGRLIVLDATESDNVLFTAARDVGQRTTTRFDWLREKVATTGCDLLIFDNASDAYDGNENDRAAVRQFLTCLKRIAPTTLLLAHVDAVSSMTDIDKAKGYSGTTGWHNSARSRWFMARDGEHIVLRVPKSNYASAGTEADIEWDSDRMIFNVATVRDGRVTAKASRNLLLHLLAQVLDSGKNISPSPNASTNLFKSLEPLDSFPKGLRSKDVHAELARWLAGGLVKVETYKMPNRREGARLAITDQGRALAA